jgi:NDP-sugar pyrophosphorylase family protein
MEAVILAGGKGTRLRPYTAEIPKPLVTVGDTPIIEILLRQMKKCGVTKVHIAVNHLAHLIMAVLGDGERLGVDIVYSHEKKALSTVGPIKLIKNLPEHFIVANGDILTDLDFNTLFNHHVSSQAIITVATHQRISKIDYGVMELGENGSLTGFREKPEYTFMVSMGVYVFSREILKLVPSERRFGFDDLMFTLLERKERINLFPFNGYWLDIGRPEDYELANADIEKVHNLTE